MDELKKKIYNSMCIDFVTMYEHDDNENDIMKELNACDYETIKYYCFIYDIKLY